VEVRDVARTYGRGATAVHALRAVSFTVAEGQLVAVRGRSGSGKTTLLNIVGGLDTPTRGMVRLGGRDVAAMSERERRLLRRSTVAFVFESFGLIPTLSAAKTSASRCGSRAPSRGPARSGSGCCSGSSAWTITPTSGRASCPAASSSGWPSPGPWPVIRNC
jgi:putative ABC transport system ATP-binding protein